MLKLNIMELHRNYVLVISDGRAKVAELPVHAEISIVTYKGKVKRVNFDEGEDF